MLSPGEFEALLLASQEAVPDLALAQVWYCHFSYGPRRIEVRGSSPRVPEKGLVRLRQITSAEAGPGGDDKLPCPQNLGAPKGAPIVLGSATPFPQSLAISRMPPPTALTPPAATGILPACSRLLRLLAGGGDPQFSPQGGAWLSPLPQLKEHEQPRTHPRGSDDGFLFYEA